MIKKLSFIFILIFFKTQSSFCQIPQLWGMTAYGGANGVGSIFKINGDGTNYTLVYSFSLVDSTGYLPSGSLLRLSNGDLYGMTNSGGANNSSGVIFKFTPSTNTYTVIHYFNNLTGCNPAGALMQASDSLLYGVTTYGGMFGNGGIFSLDTATNMYILLNSFDLFYYYPRGHLTELSNGLLYGTTIFGGFNSEGSIFSFDRVTHGLTTLFDFVGLDGRHPGGIMVANNDTLYGVTSIGGVNNDGVIYSFDPVTNTYTKLHDFNNSTDGSDPSALLMQANNGRIYGAAPYSFPSTGGTIFDFDAGNFTLNHYNLPLLTGAATNTLIQASDNLLYASTQSGGTSNGGTVIRYDGSNCVNIHSFNIQSVPIEGLIEVPPNTCITVPVVQATSCAGSCDGMATLASPDSNSVMNYLWSGGQTTSSVYGLCAGTYSVSVTDTTGCISGSQFIITSPQPVSITFTETQPECYGYNGNSCAFASGGTPPYTYIWDTGALASCTQGIFAGTYSVTITDTNGCSATASSILTQPAQLQLTLLYSNATCQTCADGNASANVTGGISPYIFNWSNGVTTAGLSNILPGTFACCITDSNGCIICDSITVGYPVGISEVNSASQISVTPNPICYTTNMNYRLRESSHVKIDLYNFLKQKIKNILDLKQAAGDKQITIKTDDLADGVYYLQVNIDNKNNIIKLVKMEK